MKLDVWMPLYDSICRDFGFSSQRDLESARSLASILGNKSVKSLSAAKDRVSSIVLVCGGGGNLSDEISSIEVRWPVIAADSATTVLLDVGIKPDMIVSDLDGVVEDQIECNSQGVPVLIHAHGDNRPVIERHTGRFKGPVVGTCQCPPPENLFNFGGFTDGDRAACAASELGAKMILLAGFDFENPSMKPGKSRDTKKRKLRWARKVLDVLTREGIGVLPVAEYRGR